MSRSNDFFSEKLKEFTDRLTEDPTIQDNTASASPMPDQLGTISETIKNLEKSSKKNTISFNLIVDQQKQLLSDLNDQLSGIKHDNSSLVDGFVELVDNICRFGKGINTLNDKNISESFEMLYRLAISRAGENGIYFFPETGDKYDPECQECIESKHVEGYTENIILNVERKGFRYKGKLKRTAKVIISK
jgi:molecular chaperone GrpE (heat shock protein)